MRPSDQDERTPLLDGPQKHYNLAGLTQRAFWTLSISMWTCSFMAAFDGTVVATLLGPISSSFRASNLASWLGTSYLLSVCCFTPIYGRLCNIIGRQRTMITSLVIFGVGNALCAAAPTMQTLIMARAIAGVGGGGLQTVSSTISSDIVPLSHRGIFQGYANIIFGAGAALGPSIGGAISDAFGWRWAFWVQLPFFVLCILLAYKHIRYPSPVNADEQPKGLLPILRRVDLIGCFLLAGWIGLLIVAVSLVTNTTEVQGPTWSSPLVYGLLIASLVVFLLFVVWEVWVVAYPVVPIELLNRRTPVAVAVNNMFISVALFAQLYTVPLYFTTVRLMSAAEAGRHLIPCSVASTVASLGVGFVVRARGRYYRMLVLFAFLLLGSSMLLASWRTDTPSWRLWTDFPIIYLAGGAIMTLTIVALVGDVGRQGIAAATGLSYTARMTGQVLGVAAAGAITQSVLSSELLSRITGPGAAEIIQSIRESSSAVRGLDEPYRSAAIASYAQALQKVFIFAVITSVPVLLSSLAVKEMKPQPSQASVSADEAEDQA